MVNSDDDDDNDDNSDDDEEDDDDDDDNGDNGCTMQPAILGKLAYCIPHARKAKALIRSNISFIHKLKPNKYLQANTL